MSPRILIGFALLSILASCTTSDEEKEYLPTASGELAEIVVIADDQTTTDQFKAAVQEIFHQEIDGILPPSEPLFNVIVTSVGHFQGYFQRHHNLFILLSGDNLDAMQGIYGEQNRTTVEELIAKDSVLGFNKKNLWSDHQNVFFITAESSSTLLQKMHTRRSDLISLALQHEAETGAYKVFDKPEEKDTFYQSRLNSRGYSIRLPHSYRIARSEQDFEWLRRSSSKYDYEILIHHLPYTAQDMFSSEGMLNIRDALTQREIPGEIEGSYQIVDRAFPPVISEENFKGRYAKCMKGWWKVQNDFMGGPFISYLIYDEKGQRVLLVDGFVYGPNEDKARPLRELETILKSLDIK